MNTPQVPALPGMTPLGLNPTPITKVYSGRPGCACGCRGKYYTANDGATFRLMNKKVQNLFATFPGAVENFPGGKMIERNNRVYAVYFEEVA